MSSFVERHIVCDSCGERCTSRELSLRELREFALSLGWIRRVRRDICPGCREKQGMKYFF